MRLVIREYLSMLKESGELDALLPDLLLAMGLDPLTRPGVGVRQFGVDLPAVGIDPADGRQKLFLLTVKQGDITRDVWDTGKQAVRPSLNEIYDSYLRTRVRPEYTSLPKKIILATGGELKQDVEPDWTNYTDTYGGVHPKYGEIEFDFWGGDRLSILIEQFFMDEYLFPETAQKQMRKTIALADQNEDEPRHFYALIDEILFNRDLPKGRTGSAKRKRQKALRLINLSLNIVFHWCAEANNLRPALLCGERVILRVWDWMRQWEALDCSTTREGFDGLFKTYLSITEAYAKKLQPYCIVRDGLFGHGDDEIEYPLRVFEILGIFGVRSVALAYLMTSTQDVEERGQLAQDQNAINQMIVDVIENNPPALTPRFDGHAIDIATCLLALLFAGYIEEAAGWIDALSKHIVFAYRMGRHFPIASDSYEDLIAMSFGQDVPKETLMELSTLLPILAEWHVVLDLPFYTTFQQVITQTFTETDLQLWYPDDTTEEHIYRTNAGRESGATLSSIQLPATLEELRTRILQLRDTYDVSTKLSCFAKDWDIIGLIASRHFRTPVIPAYWQEQVDEPKLLD